jgi:para-aminobenzoate synthetase
MGDGEGPLSYLLNYCLETKSITKTTRGDVKQRIAVTGNDTLFTHLAQIMNDATVSDSNIHYINSYQGTKPNLLFLGGLVGYVGYEMKSESLAGSHKPEFITKSAGSTPDSSFLFADRLIVLDHEAGRMYVVAVYDDIVYDEQQEWMNLTCKNMPNFKSDPKAVNLTGHIKPGVLKMQLAHSRDAYISNISHALNKINQGETYEVCLTTQLSAPLVLDETSPSPYTCYQHLRKNNPAPYGAFLSFEGIHILSSSPESFLRLEEDGWITMKPIKGTLSRATPLNFAGTQCEMEEENKRRVHQLATCEKDAAENLMV